MEKKSIIQLNLLMDSKVLNNSGGGGSYNMSYDSESNDPPKFYLLNSGEPVSPIDSDIIKSIIEIAILCAGKDPFTSIDILEKSKQLGPTIDFKLNDIDDFISHCDDVKQISTGVFVWRF